MGGGSMDMMECCVEFSSSSSSCLSSEAEEKFQNFQLQEEYDAYDDLSAHSSLRIPFLKRRSKILKIVVANDIIFVLAQSGLCDAFSRKSNKRICCLNSPDQLIKSLFYNKRNDALITVSFHASDSFKSLKCRTTSIECIKRNQLDAGVPLFESESFELPSFIEFDVVNGKILTSSGHNNIKVYDLEEYSLLYTICDENVREIKISSGLMLLIFNREVDYVPLKLLSTEDGTTLISFHHWLHPNKKVNFIELLNEKVLIKQEDENLQIFDVRNSEVTEVGHTEFWTPSSFLFLHESNMFATFQTGIVALWNLQGKLISCFEDHLLWQPDHNKNNVYITSDQDILISYCKEEGTEQDECTVGSINISNISTGRCIAKICANDPSLRISPRGRISGNSLIHSTISEALKDVTAVIYDEVRNEIYTGNRGFVEDPYLYCLQPMQLGSLNPLHPDAHDLNLHNLLGFDQLSCWTFVVYCF